jgi:type II secretory pathway component PulF
MDKDEILTITAALILLFTALIDWNIYSWLTLLGIGIILLAWYTRKQNATM